MFVTCPTNFFSVFHKLMYTHFLNKVLLPLGSIFFSGNYSRYLNVWESYDKMSEEDLHKLQQERLQKMLNYAKTHVPYYAELNIPENTRLSHFPVLTKEILRNESKNLISKKMKLEKLDKNFSSGSSGIQSFTYMTKEHKAYLRALQTHWWKWGGFTPGEPLLQLGISPQRTFVKKLKDVFFRVHYLNAFSLTEKSMKSALKTVSKKSPKHIAGYPSAIYELAKYAEKEGLHTSFKSLISFGDKLFSHYHPHFNEAFDTPKVINTYGCAEGILAACQNDLPYYYIMAPHVFIEIVNDKNEKLQAGEHGHILITCLTNFAMPLIRYKLGDMGTLLPKSEYPEHRRYNYPLLKELTGRETDILKTPNGRVLTVHSFTGIFEFYPEIYQYAIVQTQANVLTIQYITDSANATNLKCLPEIENKINSLTNHSMELHFQKVSSIENSPSGKPQIIRSLVKRSSDAI